MGSIWKTLALKIEAGGFLWEKLLASDTELIRIMKGII